jgi:DNA-binding transcriptional MerR regulator
MYKINQVSRMTGLSQKRIRDYEKEGLIKPARHPNTNDRLFSDFDVKQIKRIRSLIHERGFTIPALKQLLTMARGWDVYQCREKENCDAFNNPHKQCWEIRRQGNGDYYREFCTVCPIYLARKRVKIQLLEKPHGGD